MTDQTWALPDPHYQPEFYTDVPLKRLISWVIDTLLIIVAVVVILPFTAFTGLFFLPVLALFVSFAYRVITLSNGAATLGMRFTAIEFRNSDGARINSAEAFLHTLGYTVSVAFPIIQIISMVLMATSERGQGVTDNLLGTVAVNRRARS